MPEIHDMEFAHKEAKLYQFYADELLKNAAASANKVEPKKVKEKETKKEGGK